MVAETLLLEEDVSSREVPVAGWLSVTSLDRSVEESERPSSAVWGGRGLCCVTWVTCCLRGHTAEHRQPP